MQLSHVYCVIYAYLHLLVAQQASVSDLSDMYVHSLRAIGLKAKGVHIRQATCACVAT